jgi:putative MATE family efflux protein
MGLAAIDSVYNLLKLPVNFFIGLSAGATIIISQFFGAREKQALPQAVYTAVVFALAGGLILSVSGIAAAPYCLRLLDVPEEIFSLTLSYVRIYFGGLAVSMLYNVGAGILRALGDSKTPFYVLVVSGTVNVVLDLLFVGVFRWNAAGAALATVLAQSLSAAAVLRALIKTEADWKLRPQKTEWPMLKSIFATGLPVGLQSSLYPVANMMIQASINSTGTDNIAAWALCGKLDFLIWLVTDSLAAAISTFVAQNYGAGQYARARKGVRMGLGMTLGIVAFVSAVLFFWCEPLGKLFINRADYDIIPLLGQFMRFLSPLYIFYVFGEVFSGAIRGTGETFKPMLLTLLGTCASRILWIALIVPSHRTMRTIITSYPVSWLLTAIFFAVFYYWGCPQTRSSVSFRRSDFTGISPSEPRRRLPRRWPPPRR